jgi:hypothetical protein
VVVRPQFSWGPSLICIVYLIKNGRCGAVLVGVQGSILRYAFDTGFTRWAPAFVPFVHGDVPVVPLCPTAGGTVAAVAAIQCVFYEGFCSISETSNESARQR